MFRIKLPIYCLLEWSLNTTLITTPLVYYFIVETMKIARKRAVWGSQGPKIKALNEKLILTIGQQRGCYRVPDCHSDLK